MAVRKEVQMLRESVHHFLHQEVFPKVRPGDRILEIGPMQRQWTPVQSMYVDTRKEFHKRGASYKSCDTDIETDPDFPTGILELASKVDQLEGRFDTVVACEVFEHIDRIWEVPQAIATLLKPGGGLFFTVPYHFYRHHPFPDYWRLSEDAIRLLFQPPLFEIGSLVPLVDQDERQPIQYRVVAWRLGSERTEETDDLD